MPASRLPAIVANVIAVAPIPQTALRMRLKELAAARVRYGYRRLHILLRREGWAVNNKRIYRLYREEGLAIRSKTPSRKRAWRYRSARPEARRERDLGDGLHVRPALRWPVRSGF